MAKHGVINLPERILIDAFNERTADRLGALAMSLSIKANFVDSKIHDYVEKRYSTTYQIGKQTLNRYIEAGEKFGLLDLSERRRYYAKGSRKSHQDRPWYVSKNGKGTMVKDLLAPSFKKVRKEKCIKLYTIDLRTEGHGVWLYVKTDSYDYKAKVEAESGVCQSIKDIIQLLRDVYVLLLKQNHNGWCGQHSRSEDSLCKQYVGESEDDYPHAPAPTKECKKLAVSLDDRLYVGHISSYNGKDSVDKILKCLDSPLFSRGILVRTLKDMHERGLIQCVINYLLIKDFSNLKKAEGKPVSMVDCPYDDPIKKCIWESSQSCFNDYMAVANQRREYLNVYDDKSGRFLFNLMDSGRCWFGRGEDNEDCCYIRLANSYRCTSYLRGIDRRESKRTSSKTSTTTSTKTPNRVIEGSRENSLTGVVAQPAEVFCRA